MGQIAPPAWLEDTATRGRVFFFHAGPNANHVHNLGFFVSPGNHWWIPTLAVSEGTAPLAAGGDFVNIMAGTAMQHITAVPGHPDDWPFGAPAAFAGPAMNAAAFPRGGSMQSSIDVVHAKGHIDRYTIRLTINVQGAQITAYRISFTVDHLAEEPEDLEQRQQQQVEP